MHLGALMEIGLVSDIAIFVLKRDVKLQLTNWWKLVSSNSSSSRSSHPSPRGRSARHAWPKSPASCASGQRLHAAHINRWRAGIPETRVLLEAELQVPMQI